MSTALCGRQQALHTALHASQAQVRCVGTALAPCYRGTVLDKCHSAGRQPASADSALAYACSEALRPIQQPEGLMVPCAQTSSSPCPLVLWSHGGSPLSADVYLRRERSCDNAQRQAGCHVAEVVAPHERA